MEPPKDQIINIPERGTRRFSSGEFHYFLIDLQDRKPKDLPEQINLSYHKPTMQAMYNERKIVETVDLGSIGERMGMKNVELPGERYSGVYIKDYGIETTPIVDGEFDEVESLTYKLASEGYLPLLDIHTHPTDSLPSPADYRTLLIDWGAGHRFQKAALVLSPGRQVLAVATADTPMLTPDAANKLIQDWTQSIKDKGTEIDEKIEKKKQERVARIERAEGRVEKIGSSYRAALDDMLRNIRSREDTQQISKEEAGELTHSAVEQYMRIFEFGSDLALKKGLIELDAIKEGIDSFDSRQQFGNQTLIQFAHLIGVKLYSSTDMENFTEFSA